MTYPGELSPIDEFGLHDIADRLTSYTSGEETVTDTVEQALLQCSHLVELGRSLGADTLRQIIEIQLVD